MPVMPPWTRVANRRLLQLSTKANIVVAKDGSGNFTTIKDALNSLASSSQRISNGRFVIYVKRGVYAENVQIDSSLDNLTFVGDGMGQTVITSGRSVSGGYTTFSSATFSKINDLYIELCSLIAGICMNH